MSKKKENKSFLKTENITAEKKANKVERYVFKTTYKKWSLIFKRWEIVTMSPCEAQEYKQFVYPYSPKVENCDCAK